MSVVANVYRGEVVESTHVGHVAVVDATGRLLYAYGDPFRHVFGRSSMKPIQTLPVIATGTAADYEFAAADLAICCGSHNGEKIHCDCAENILKKAGCDEDMLHCGVQQPYDDDSYRRIILAHKEPTPLFTTCSGLHAGMLATAANLKEDIETYHLPEHPVQRRVFDAVSDLTGLPKDRIRRESDGCSVPTYQMPLAHLALGYARLSHPDAIPNQRYRKAAEQVVDAMVVHPEMVGGTKRYCTDLMTAFRGRVIGKEGAEGMYCVGDRELGIGIAVKIEDGSKRALYATVNHALAQLGLLNQGDLHLMSHYTDPGQKNMCSQVVGQIRAEYMLHPVGQPLQNMPLLA